MNVAFAIINFQRDSCCWGIFMESGKMVLLLAACLPLLLFGCLILQQPAPAPAPTPEPAAQPAPQPAPSPAPAEPNNTSATPAPPPAPAEKCSVEFHKDQSSSIHYITVKTDSVREITVTCPSGQAGMKQNALYFCDKLDSQSPAIAYIDGVECGRSTFGEAGTATTTGKHSCALFLSSSTVNSGQSVVVSFNVYSPEKRQLLFKCGENDVSLSADGMVEMGKVCRFDTPGEIEVYVKLNGETCAAKTLRVIGTD